MNQTDEWLMKHGHELFITKYRKITKNIPYLNLDDTTLNLFHLKYPDGYNCKICCNRFFDYCCEHVNLKNLIELDLTNDHIIRKRIKEPNFEKIQIIREKYPNIYCGTCKFSNELFITDDCNCENDCKNSKCIKNNYCQHIYSLLETTNIQLHIEKFKIIFNSICIYQPQIIYKKSKEIIIEINFESCGIFTIPIWQNILKCFESHISIDLSIRYGSQQLSWVMNNQPYLPSDESWEQALNIKTRKELSDVFLTKNYEEKLNFKNNEIKNELKTSRGMLIYLIKWDVVCPYLDKLIQFCIANNLIKEWLLFQNPDHIFKTKNGEIYKSLKIHGIDMACCKGYLTMIKLMKNFYKLTKYSFLLHSPDLTCLKVIETKRLDILQEIIPDLTRINNTNTLKKAASDENIFLFLLNYLKEGVMNDIIILTLAKYGFLKSIQLCLQRYSYIITMTQKVWDIAYIYNHLNICNAFPEYQFHDDLLIKVCKLGHYDVIKNLDLSIHLPEKCIEASIYSGNAKLIGLVHARIFKLTNITPKYTKTMLMDSIEKINKFIYDEDDTNLINIDPFIAVFIYGEFEELDDDIKVKLVEYNCQSTLQYLHDIEIKTGISLNIFNQQVFEKAAECCNVEILKMMKHLPWSDEILTNASRLIYIGSINDEMTNTKPVELIKEASLIIEETRKLSLKYYMNSNDESRLCPIIIIFPITEGNLSFEETSYKSLAKRKTRIKILSKLIKHNRESVLFVLNLLLLQTWWSDLELKYLQEDLDWVKLHGRKN